jgi:hypothetical protein
MSSPHGLDNSKYGYTPLSHRTIRVLELHHGNEEDPVVCTIIAQKIEDMAYEAISYVWGDASLSFPITCNGKRLFITQNLGSALKAFRLKDTARRLWADGICIDQADLQERHAQVRMMGEIYSVAQGVLAWLGHDPGTAQVATSFIREFNRRPEVFINPWRVAPQSNSNRVQWDAIKEMFSQPYFHRVWIIQELSLAKRAQMRYGQHWIDWQEISTFVFTLDNQAAFLVETLQLNTSLANHTFLA